jgi:hypothetical protein
MTVTITAGPTGITAGNPAWLRLRTAAESLQALQIQDGSVPERGHHAAAALEVAAITGAVRELAPTFRHDAAYLDAVVADFEAWAQTGFGVPDFLSSLLAFQPQLQRQDGLAHLVIFPMYTQNGSSSRLVEAVLVEVIWPDFVAELEAGAFSNKLFVPIRFLDSSRKPLPSGKRPPSPGALFSRTVKLPASAASCVRRRTSPPWSFPRVPPSSWRTRSWLRPRL